MKNETQLPNTIVKLLDKQKKIKYTNKRKVLKAFVWSFSLIIIVVIIALVALFMAGVIFNG